MVKLCRLTSDDSILNFNSSIQSNLTLPKQSKIGLANVSWEKALFEFKINNSNNKITLKFENDSSGSNELTALLSYDSYSINNFQDLLTDIKIQLNNGLVTSMPSMIGISIDVYEIVQDDTIRISAYQNSIIDFFRTTSDDNYENVNCQDTGTNVYKRIATGTTLYDSALYGKLDNYFFSTGTGCGVLRCKINEISTTTGDKGFYIGLTNIRPENLGGNYDFQPDKISFGIGIRTSVQPYGFIKTVDGVATIGYNKLPAYIGVGDDDNDVLEISMTQGKITGKIYNNTYINGFTLFEEEYVEASPPLFPILAFQSDTASIRKLRYTPQVEKTPNSYALLQSSLLGTPQPPQQDLNPCTYTINFESKLLSSFLGFVNNEISDFGVGFNFRAVTPVSFFDNSEAYIIELMNLHVDSYDFSPSKQNKRYILQIIQNQRNKAERDVLYETTTPIMIDLNNTNEILLKNLQLRILNSTESEVNINGISNLTLIFN